MNDLIYIASPSFSGSTILTFVLGAHRQIATIGELKWGDIDLKTYSCSCGTLLRDCAFWKKVSERVQARGLPFNLHRPATDFRFRSNPLADRVARARLRGPVFESVRGALVSVLPACRDSWSEVVELNKAMMEIIIELKSASMFLDASKDPVRLKHLMDCGQFRVWLIQLVRDGRAVINSAIKNEKQSAETAAQEWLRTHHQIERLAARLGPQQVCRIRYEDMCADLDGSRRNLFEFLQLNPSDCVADFRAVDHHILGNRMRLQPSSEVRLDEKWRAELADSDRACFERIAGAMNRKYGYEG